MRTDRLLLLANAVEIAVKEDLQQPPHAATPADPPSPAPAPRADPPTHNTPPPTHDPPTDTPHDRRLQADIDALVAVNWRPPLGTPLRPDHLQLAGSVLHRLQARPATHPPPQHTFRHVIAEFPALADDEGATFIARQPLGGARVDPHHGSCDRSAVDLAATIGRPTPDAPRVLLKGTAKRCADGSKKPHVYKKSRGCSDHKFRSIHIYYLGYCERPPTAQCIEKWRVTTTTVSDLPVQVHCALHHTGYALWDVSPVLPASEGRAPTVRKRLQGSRSQGGRAHAPPAGAVGGPPLLLPVPTALLPPPAAFHPAGPWHHPHMPHPVFIPRGALAIVLATAAPPEEPPPTSQATAPWHAPPVPHPMPNLRSTATAALPDAPPAASVILPPPPPLSLGPPRLLPAFQPPMDVK